MYSPMKIQESEHIVIVPKFNFNDKLQKNEK